MTQYLLRPSTPQDNRFPRLRWLMLKWRASGVLSKSPIQDDAADNAVIAFCDAGAVRQAARSWFRETNAWNDSTALHHLDGNLWRPADVEQRASHLWQGNKNSLGKIYCCRHRRQLDAYYVRRLPITKAHRLSRERRHDRAGGWKDYVDSVA